MRLILASTSPRRRQILGLLGLPFDVIPPDFEEIVSDQRSIEDEVLYFGFRQSRISGQTEPPSDRNWQ